MDIGKLIRSTKEQRVVVVIAIATALFASFVISRFLEQAASQFVADIGFLGVCILVAGVFGALALAAASKMIRFDSQTGHFYVRITRSKEIRVP